MANSATTCNCGRNGSVQLVFALGKLGIEFETEARFDSIRNHMEKPDPKNEVDPNPYDPEQLLNHFTKNPWDAASVIWTLNLDAVPIYAIKPEGAFAQEAYKELRNFLNDQINNSCLLYTSGHGAVPGLAVTAPAWPAHPAWLSEFLKLLGTKIEL